VSDVITQTFYNQYYLHKVRRGSMGRLRSYFKKNPDSATWIRSSLLFYQVEEVTYLMNNQHHGTSMDTYRKMNCPLPVYKCHHSYTVELHKDQNLNRSISLGLIIMIELAMFTSSSCKVFRVNIYTKTDVSLILHCRLLSVHPSDIRYSRV
jgi:hypothetical protein